jgi:hypothetical protein
MNAATDDDEGREILAEINDLATGWAEYPETAPQFDVPAGFEDFDDEYQGIVIGVGDAGALWNEFVGLATSGVESPDVFNEFNLTFSAELDNINSLLDEIEAAGDGDSSAATGEDADADAYLDAVRAHLDELTAGSAFLEELFAPGRTLTDADREDAGEAIEAWSLAPDRAAKLEAPDGYEELQAMYEDTAAAYATSYQAFLVYLDAEPGSDDAGDAFTAYLDTFGVTVLQTMSLNALLTEAGV